VKKSVFALVFGERLAALPLGLCSLRVGDHRTHLASHELQEGEVVVVDRAALVQAEHERADWRRRALLSTCDGGVSRKNETWQEWQGWAFARVRMRSLVSTETLQTSGSSERLRTGANLAGSCHAEGRGFESHHPLLNRGERTSSAVAGLPEPSRSNSSIAATLARTSGIGTNPSLTIATVAQRRAKWMLEHWEH
jgi:hypothetical protein